MTQSLSRTEIYQRIWATPLIRVAADLGITNFHLAKLCRQHSIPTPTSGYWSKMAHGKAPSRSSLPAAPDCQISLVGLQRPGFRPSRPAAVAEPDKPTTEEVEIDDPKVEKTLAKLRNQTGAGLRLAAGKGCFRVCVTERSIERAQNVLNALVREARARNWVVKDGDAGIEFSAEGENIGFELTELTDRVAHLITEAETAKSLRYQARLESAKRTGAYVSPWDAPKIPEWDRVPNGKLSLKLDDRAAYRDVRRTFSDRKTQTVETLIDCVIVAMEGYAASEKALRIEQENRRIAAEEAELVRREEARRAELEGRRVEFLDRQLARLDRLERVTALLNAIEQRDCSEELDRFVDWASGYVGQLKAELSADSLTEKLRRTKLMNEDTVIPRWIDVETGRYS